VLEPVGFDRRHCGSVRGRDDDRGRRTVRVVWTAAWRVSVDAWLLGL
jgi:hypothetical protein